MNSPIKNDRAAWLQGPAARCAAPPKELDRPWRIVLLGAPGVGKGTQAEMLGKTLGGCHLSTGDVFRAAATSCCGHPSPAMAAALEYMRRGDLVPDFNVWQIIRERAACISCRGGFVLDGFPRTLPQAQSFQQLLHEEGLSLDSVVNYELPMPEIIARLSGRRVCAKCKVVFHQTQSPPKLEGICDRCGGALVQREDDRAESVKVRLEAYTRETAPLIGFYRDAGLLLSVNAAGTPKEVFARSIASLEAAVTDGTLRSRNPWDSISGLGGGEMNHGSYKERL